MPEFDDQLFHYAQDLADLLDQHTRLQKRYQAVLELQGQSFNSKDLFFDHLTLPAHAFLACDLSGNITLTSRAACQALHATSTDLKARTIDDLADATSRTTVVELLEQFGAGVGGDALVQCRLALRDIGSDAAASPFDVFALPVRDGDQCHVYWLLVPATTVDSAPIELQQNILPDADNCSAMMIIDKQRRITAVNRSFVAMTGFNDSEVLLRDPGILSSGRHTDEFFRAFWIRLTNCGSWTGQFFNRRKNGHIYPEWKTVKTVRNLAGDLISYISTAQDVSDGENSVRRLSRLAYYDNLTGLPNRRLLDDRLALATNPATSKGTGSFGLMYLDLNDFKPINDQLGHDVGDAVLVEVGRRLRQSVRRADTVARIGGDEFVVLLQSTAQAADVQRVAETIQGKLSVPMQVGSHRLQIGVSIGCARFPIDGEDGASLLKNADVAMYQAKQHGRNQFRFYNPAAAETGLSTLGQDIWSACQRNELSLVYQPLVTSTTPHVLSGCEAFLRWNSPTAGNIEPSILIPMAENNGAIVSIGLWVLETACAQLRAWRNRGLGDFPMSVNISPRQIRDADFVGSLRAVLEKNDISPQGLVLEISESNLALLDDNDCRKLEELRQAGVRVSIDDFGSGGTSVKRLKTFPVDQLKIDRNFIQDIVANRDARAISNCFAGIGAALGIEVVAEGVETVEQVDVLVGQGCQLLQGYLTGRPMSPQAFSASAFWRQQFGARMPVKSGASQ